MREHGVDLGPDDEELENVLTGAVDSQVNNKVLEDLEEPKESESAIRDKEEMNHAYFEDIQGKMRERI